MDGMITCPRCGEQMDSHLKFCTNCGASLQEAPASVNQHADDDAGGATCPACGAPIVPGTKFCVNCGRPLEAGDSKPENPEAPKEPDTEEAHAQTEEPHREHDSAEEGRQGHAPAVIAADPSSSETRVLGNSETRVLENRKAQVEGTASARPIRAAMDPQPSPVQQPYSPTEQSGSGKTDRDKMMGMLAIVVCALAVVVVVLVILFMNSQKAATTQGDQGSSQAQSQEQSAPDETDGSQTASPSAAAPSAPDQSDAAKQQETAIHDTLQGHVGTLNSLDGQIRSVADDFNLYSKDGTSAQMQSCYSNAMSVQSSVSNAASQLSAMNVPSSSAYYATWQSMIVCYEDLQNRIDCMVQAWSLRTQGYSNYLDPLAAQNDSNGVNVYKTDFENRMNQISL